VRACVRACEFRFYFFSSLASGKKQNQLNRLVIASDGIWDVLNEQQIAGFLRRSKDPRKAAMNISEVGKRRRLYGGLSPDDCSVIVVNLDDAFS
jgi:serine/threonine protein phosphatase PrpC